MPGATTSPSASITCCAASPGRRPIAVTLPPYTATSAGRPGSPVPSTTRPPRISRSCMGLRTPRHHLGGGGVALEVGGEAGEEFGEAGDVGLVPLRDDLAEHQPPALLQRAEHLLPFGGQPQVRRPPVGPRGALD